MILAAKYSILWEMLHRPDKAAPRIMLDQFGDGALQAYCSMSTASGVSASTTYSFPSENAT